MALVTWRPFDTTMEPWRPARALAELQSGMNRLFENALGQPASAGAERGWAPVCDVWETPDDVIISFEIPGVSEKDANVSINGDFLTVKGERPYPDSAMQDAKWHRFESAYGRFERTLQLAIPVQADKVTASYRDGVLTVRLPKSERLKPKQIQIEAL